MNAFMAVAIIIAVFFIAGLMVGFLIVMALPVLVHRRGKERWEREPGGSRRGNRRRVGDGHGPLRPGWQEPPHWPGTGPSGRDPYSAGRYDDDDDTGDQGGPPYRPWWLDT